MCLLVKRIDSPRPWPPRRARPPPPLCPGPLRQRRSAPADLSKAQGGLWDIRRALGQTRGSAIAGPAWERISARGPARWAAHGSGRPWRTGRGKSGAPSSPQCSRGPGPRECSGWRNPRAYAGPAAGGPCGAQREERAHLPAIFAQGKVCKQGARIYKTPSHPTASNPLAPWSSAWPGHPWGGARGDAGGCDSP